MDQEFGYDHSHHMVGVKSTDRDQGALFPYKNER